MLYEEDVTSRVQGTSVSYGTRVEVDEQCNGGAEMTADESLIPG